LIILTGGAPHSSHNTSVPLSDDSKEQAVYSGLFQTALLLFRFTIGMGDLEYNENVKYSDLAMLLVLLFVILTYILLLNMLIALMSETVTNVSGYSQSVWQLQVRPRDWDGGHSWPSRGLNGTRPKEPAEEKFVARGSTVGSLVLSALGGFLEGIS
ncbi:transient receptor potential cation channel subfamily V member 2-like, partial [Pseudonaja textilis]|uniref:transient receptor potential cation channel subfamily V member 2-like n=1 Tax=Pseudonaja textilis TaxID=8673 RepID=UPI000EAA8483